MMRAWQYNSAAGGRDMNLVLGDDLPIPEVSPRLGDSEVLVEVISAALNPVDYKLLELGRIARTVASLPATPGMDFCGRIAKVGRTVDSVAIGELVFGKLDPKASGALAEFTIAKASECASLPASVDPDYGAAVGTAGMTAYQVIQPNVKDGDKIFINGGSGGVGTFAIQIAKALGCHVTVSCSTGKVALCKELGADEVIDYKTTNVTAKLRETGQVFSLVVDNIATSPSDLYQASEDYLLPSGKFVQVGGEMSWESVTALGSRMLLPSFLGGGRRKFEFYVFVCKKDTMVQLAKWMVEGKIKPVIEEVFKFEEVPAAFQKLRSGSCAGKVIVHVKENQKA